MAKRQDIGFVIPGSATADSVLDADGGDAVLRSGRSKGAVRLGARRGAGESVRLVASPGEDVVVLGIDNGPTLVLHPENARDLMLSQDTRSRSASRGAAEVEVPAQLGWPGLEQAAGQGATRGAPMRGWLGRVVLRSFEVITGIAKDNAANMLAATATRRLDGRVDAGVYRLGVEPFEALKTSGRKLDTVSPGTSDRPLLVLVHGTFVDTASTFGQLWRQHPQRVEALFEHYRGRVFALDHPTLGESPIGNALTLLRAMPDEARLHLLTHSRGGLVAEALARASAGRPLGKAEIALFDGPALANHRAELEALYELAARKRLRIERVVRVACPARGTLLASTRLDAYLSVLRWGLQVAGIAVLPEFVDFLAEVARRRADPRQLPGLEAMMPGSAVIQWLNRAEAPLPGELRVVAGDAAGDTLGAWIKTLLADAFFWTDNDLVVQTRSMYGGTPRGTAEPTSAGAAAAAPQAGNAASFVLDRGDKVTHFGYFANESTAAAICNGLIEDAPPEFQPIGPLSAAGKDPSGSRAEQAVRRSRGPGDDGRPASERPAVVVLPGILGSNLALDGDRIWLGWRDGDGTEIAVLDPANGELTARDVLDGRPSAPTARAVADGALVVALRGESTAWVRLDVEGDDISTAWVHELDGDERGADRLAISGRSVVGYTDGDVVSAVGLDDGRRLWDVTTTSFNNNDEQIAATDGGATIVGSFGGAYLEAFDADGGELWTLEPDEVARDGSPGSVATLGRAGGLVVATSPADGAVVVVAVAVD